MKEAQEDSRFAPILFPFKTMKKEIKAINQ